MDTIRQLKHYIAQRSDSGTAAENNMREALLDHIGGMAYFQAHPEYFGEYDGGDPLGRKVVWALKRGSGKETLVLTGHYDAVETGVYGAWEPCALDPEALKRYLLEEAPELQGNPSPEYRLLREDLESGDWLCGRGSNDMKAGLAISLQILEEHEPAGLNVLFTAVYDEENLSAGARAAGGLYRELTEKYGLSYVLGLLPEPDVPEPVTEQKGPLPVYNGSCGKIMPVVVVKGKPAHGARMTEGLSACSMLARILVGVEGNTSLISRDQGMSTQPPCVLFARDIKDHYDVSMPEYAGAALSFTFLKGTNPLSILDKVRDIAQEGAAASIRFYEQCYTSLAEAGVVQPEGLNAYEAQVLTLGELSLMAEDRPGYEAFRSETAERLYGLVRGGRETLVSATIAYLKALLEFTNAAPGTCVVGIAPPYYPPAFNGNGASGSSLRIDELMRGLADAGQSIAFEPYSVGITDMSYLSCSDPQAEEIVMRNIPLRGELYDIDFYRIHETGFPCLRVGPRGRFLHQKGERVYLPDVTDTVPALYRAVIALLEKRAADACVRA